MKSARKSPTYDFVLLSQIGWAKTNDSFLSYFFEEQIIFCKLFIFWGKLKFLV
jgi:hypothetical protein